MRYFCYHIYYSIKYPQTHTQNESCWFASFDANQIETFNRWKEQATPSVEFPDDVNELRGQLFDIGALRETLLGDDFHYLGVEVWLSFDFRGIYHRNYVLNRLNYLKSHLLETAKDETFLDSVHSSDPYRLMMECTNGDLLTEHELDSYIQKLSGFGLVQEFS